MKSRVLEAINRYKRILLSKIPFIEFVAAFITMIIIFIFHNFGK